MQLSYEILMDKRENPRKCTIAPLKDRADFHIRYFSHGRKISAFTATTLLHVEGELIQKAKSDDTVQLAVIDCNWRKVPSTLQRVALPLPKLVRIPEGFVTAYPRANKEGKDPEHGLATIEALFLAAAFFGNWDESLLEKYYFKDLFLQKNSEMFREHGLGNYGSK